MNIEEALNKLEDLVLRNNDDELDKIYLTLLYSFNDLNKKLETVNQEKEIIQSELDERKEIIWNDPQLRSKIINQALSAANGKL